MKIRLAAVAPVLALIGGCAAKPVLYPNAHFQEAGKERSRQDIADCRNLADQYVSSQKAAKVAAGTAEGGAVGGAMGAAGGAVLGAAGPGAAVGAAAGAAGGLVRAAFHARQPSPVYKSFFKHCMKERGYAVVGWQ